MAYQGIVIQGLGRDSWVVAAPRGPCYILGHRIARRSHTLAAGQRLRHGDTAGRLGAQHVVGHGERAV
eukprot:1098064-Alexandrium_andersonii.AAC.1